jgi:hypothetical protein
MSVTLKKIPGTEFITLIGINDLRHVVSTIPEGAVIRTLVVIGYTADSF